MSSKVKLVKGLCVSLVMLLMAGDAVGAVAGPDVRTLQRNAMTALQQVRTELPSVLQANVNDDHARLVQRAIKAIHNDNENPGILSHARAMQNINIAMLARDVFNNHMAIVRGEQGRSKSLAEQEEQLRYELDHRVQ